MRIIIAIIIILSSALFFVTGWQFGFNAQNPPVIIRLPPVSSTPDELQRANQIIDAGIANHRYYVGHPDEQTWQTGNTTLNQQWIGNYEFLKALYQRAYFVVKEGE